MSFQEAHGQALLGKDLGIAHFSLGPDKRRNRKSSLAKLTLPVTRLTGQVELLSRSSSLGP